MGFCSETISHYSTIGAPLATVGLGPVAVAGGSAALSDKSQQSESDPMSAFQKLMPFLNDIPLIRDLDVEDTDHPLLKTAKNTLQEMGLAKAFDVALQALFPGNPKFKQIADAETANVDRQIGEMAIEQVRVRDLGPTPQVNCLVKVTCLGCLLQSSKAMLTNLLLICTRVTQHLRANLVMC